MLTDNRVYPTTLGRINRKDLESEASSTETEVSDAERNLSSRGRPRYRGRRGGFRNNTSRGQERFFFFFLEDHQPYQLRDRPPPSLLTTLNSRTPQTIYLSSHILTNAEMGILQKGLSFVPTSKFNIFKWTTDLNLLACKLRWCKYFLHPRKTTVC